ncbi:MAG: MaoC family dehydratase [Chloroflexi bacterium]|nr:MAG: MaoC family dehydratase [Chloroflexota bacterium]
MVPARQGPLPLLRGARGCRGQEARHRGLRRDGRAEPVSKVAGKTYPQVETRLEADHVRAFAEAIGADPEAGVPPTYAAVYALFSTAVQLYGDEDAAVDFQHLLHSEQEFSWTRHPEVGETVLARGRVEEDVERRNLRFLTYATSVDSGGEPLCSSRMVNVIRG